MWTNFFKHIDILPENANLLDGNASDLVAECDLFEEKIKAAGGIELFIGGKDWESQLPYSFWLSLQMSVNFLIQGVEWASILVIKEMFKT